MNHRFLIVPLVDALRMVSLMQQYFDNVGDKACCFEDLKPYYGLDGEDLTKWIAYLEAIPLSVVSGRLYPRCDTANARTDDRS